MQYFETEEEYVRFVETLAKQNMEGDNADTHHVAECAITDTHVIDKENVTLLFNGEPYTETRTTPTQVLLWALSDATQYDVSTNYRSDAVNLLANDIEEMQTTLTEYN